MGFERFFGWILSGFGVFLEWGFGIFLGWVPGGFID